jgi:hypothetical protein
MCYELDSNVILVNYLEKGQNCTISDLIYLKSRIENEIPDVYVDVSRNSIISTVENHPRSFKFIDGTIEMNEKDDNYILFIKHILKKKYSQPIENVIEKYIRSSDQ